MLGNYRIDANRVPEGIKKLKNEKHIYLYGNSVYAESIFDILNKFYVDIEGVLVSKEYYQEKRFKHIAIYEAEEFIAKTKEDIVIVAGFNVLVHKQLRDKLTDENKVKTIYVLNGCQVLWNNGFHFLGPKIFLVDNYYEELIKRDLNYQYFKKNSEMFFQTYSWLEDKKSKKTMEEYLRGHIELTNFPMLDLWKHDDVENQYFPEDIIQLKNDEVFVDCGAYTGDTAASFLRRVDKFKKYYALEPDSRRFDELKSKLEKDMVHISVGAWSEKKRLYFSQECDCGEIMSDTKQFGEYINVDKIDDLIDSNDKVTFIKMDIEGAELPALYGAEQIIKKNKPVLAICVYHKREDLITIPQFIKRIVPEYKLYLRAHFAYASELVLYAIYE